MNSRWYLKIGKQVIGPIGENELIDMIRSGQVGPATLIMEEDGTGFSPIRGFPAFGDFFAEPEPPAPAPPSFIPPLPDENPPDEPARPADPTPEEPYLTPISSYGKKKTPNDENRPDPLIIALMVVGGLLVLTIAAGVIWFMLSGTRISDLGRDATPTAPASATATDPAGTRPAAASAAVSSAATADPSAVPSPLCVFDRTQFDLTRCFDGGTLDESDDALFAVGTDSSSIYRLDPAATTRTLIVMAPAPIGSLNVSGDFLYYLSSRELYRVPLDGGAPESLPEAGSMDSLLILNDVALAVDSGKAYLLDEALQRTQVSLSGAKSDGILFYDETFLYYYGEAGRKVERLNIQSGETKTLLEGVDSVMAATPEGIYAYDNDRKKLTLYDYEGNAVASPVDGGVFYTGCAVGPGGLYLFSGELDSAAGIDYRTSSGSVQSVFLPPSGRCMLSCQTRGWALFEVQSEGGGASAFYLLNLETGAVIPFT